MSFQSGTATGYDDLLNQLDTYLTGQGMCLSPLFTGAGNGLISNLQGGAASLAENITITFTASNAFNVAGSVSGAIGAGTVGTAFASSKLNFLITAGSIPFAAGDTFTFSTTVPWTSERRVAGSEMIWKAPGNGNTEQIFVGAKTFSNSGADYYNWRLGGFVAFDAALDFFHQAGYPGGPGQANPSPVLNLWNQGINYWFVANGRRVVIVAKISSVYMMAYLGLLSSYVSPGAFPYPLVVGGSMAWSGEPGPTDTRWRWSYTGPEMSNFPFSYNSVLSYFYQSQVLLRLPTGNWDGFSHYNGNNQPWGRVWPYTLGPTNLGKNLDGGYALFPIVYHDIVPNNVYGEPEGVDCVTGVQNAAENTITIGSSIYLVVQNVFRNTSIDYCAVKLI